MGVPKRRIPRVLSMMGDITFTLEAMLDRKMWSHKVRKWFVLLFPVSVPLYFLSNLVLFFLLVTTAIMFMVVWCIAEVARFSGENLGEAKVRFYLLGDEIKEKILRIDSDAFEKEGTTLALSEEIRQRVAREFRRYHIPLYFSDEERIPFTRETLEWYLCECRTEIDAYFDE